MPEKQPVLILTPAKNAAAYLDDFFRLAAALDYPADQLAIGMLEGDSDDDTFAVCDRYLKKLNSRFSRTDRSDGLGTETAKASQR